MNKSGGRLKYLCFCPHTVITLLTDNSQSILADAILCFSALDSLMRERQTWLGAGRNGEDWSNGTFPLAHMIES